jgi:hypothetical protein
MVRQSAKLKNLQGTNQKDLIGIPWMLAFALRADGWYLRQDIIWHKPNPMPESVQDRCTKSHEYIFLMSKSQKYYYDADQLKKMPSLLVMSVGLFKVSKVVLNITHKVAVLEVKQKNI